MNTEPRAFEFYWPGVLKCIVWERSDRLKLVALYVKEDWQGCGVGSAVIRELKRRGKRIVLIAAANAGRQTDLERFYRRHGFRVCAYDSDFLIWEPA